MDLLMAILIFALIWAGPSAILSAWLMSKLSKERLLKGFIGSLIITTGFIFAVIGAIKLSSTFHNDTIGQVIILSYFPLAGIVWGGLDYLTEHKLTVTQLLTKLGIPPLAAVIVGAAEIAGAVLSPMFLLLLLLQLTIPGIFWLIVRVPLKQILGVKEDLKFELFLAGIGFISGILIYSPPFILYRGLTLVSETEGLLLLSLVPYIVIGIIDSVFNLLLKGEDTEVDLKKRAVLVFLPMYLSIAFVGYVILVWEMLAHEGA